VRDADSAVREHIASHLPALVETFEADGRAAAAAVDSAAAALVAAWAAREQIATALSQLIVRVGPVDPHDVSRSKAEEAARACRVLLDSGGEEPVTLTRTRLPWSHLLAAEETVPA
jgi:hypothetical protein